MKLFGYKTREKRRGIWPPLSEPHHYLQLAEPRNVPDRVSILKQRIAEVDCLYPAGSRIANAMIETRSPEFTPEWPSPPQLHSVRDARRWMVSTTCKKRSTAIPEVESLISPAGKLLVFEVDLTVWDGTSETVSDGYFDSTDEPGWNTWIDYYEDQDREIGARLLCYVPPALIDLADSGIAANPVGCIDWFVCPDLIPAS